MHGLRFIRLVLAGEDAALSHRCNTMEERVRQWKATLRPAKKLQQLKSSTASMSVHDAVAILRSEKLVGCEEYIERGGNRRRGNKGRSEAYCGSNGHAGGIPLLV